MTANQIGFTRPAILVCALAVATPGWAVSVSLTSPTNSVVAGPATITVTATAMPGSGRRILRVDFFRGATRIGTDTSAPYGVVLSNVPVGTYVFTALAIDSGGSVAISDPVLVRVDSPPSVALTTPTDNSTFAPGADIQVTASASDSDEVVRKVEFFAGDTLIGTQVLTPYQIIWSGVPSGRYRLIARATDLAGLATNSVPVTITVGSAPTVAITSPAPGAVLKGGTITVTAQASDSDGTVAKVEFFDGGNFVGTAIASTGGSTYSASLSKLAVGSHTLTARAIDDQGLSSTSNPVAISVTAAMAQMYFIHTDHLNTPRMIANQQGTIVWKWDNTEPFGDSVPNGDPNNIGVVFDLALRFPGQYYDKETARHYNSARDYDPSTGRYEESDPIGLKGGMNTYAYSSLSPLTFNDPSGLAVWFCTRHMRDSYIPVANHGYFFDDKTSRCCGDPGYGAKDPLKTCRERGPKKDSCILISSSDSDTEKLLQCCNKKTNENDYWPFFNDCMNVGDDCIREIGMAPPATPDELRWRKCPSCWRK